LSALRARIAALEARRENGAWREEKPPAPPDERPHHPAATPFFPAEYGNLFDAERDPPAETAFVEDADKPPFPLR
jgi:hypothetical protein